MLNKIFIVGNLGADPEMRYTPGGQGVTNFSCAANRQFTRSDGTKETETLWVRVSCWGKLAETVNNWLSKGDLVHIEGRLKPDKETHGPRVYQRQDGAWASSFEVDAERVLFLKVARETARGSVEQQQQDDFTPPF